MIEQLEMYLMGLPAFLSYFAIGGILLLIYITLYNWITPINEWELVKQNDPAAAIGFAGSIIGFVLPLESAIENAQTNIECILWGCIALIVQLSVFFVVRMFLPRLSERIKAGEVSAGIVLAAISISVGMINAASMTF